MKILSLVLLIVFLMLIALNMGLNTNTAFAASGLSVKSVAVINAVDVDAVDVEGDNWSNSRANGFDSWLYVVLSALTLLTLLNRILLY